MHHYKPSKTIYDVELKDHSWMAVVTVVIEVVKVLLWILQKVLVMEYYVETNCGNWYEHQQ